MRIDDLEHGWRDRLAGEFSKSYMRRLQDFLLAERDAGKVIFPSEDARLLAFRRAPFARVRVVILGQDPYHGPGQAHGLCFSVPSGERPPPSLVNIFKERKTDLGFERPVDGCLLEWAARGALLLNAVLTVESGRAGSHQGRGWEQLTDRAIDALNVEREGLAFVLWGAHAQKKGALIDRKRHLVIEERHPSPLSASRGFFGSRPFSKINAYFAANGQSTFDWSLPQDLPLRPQACYDGVHE